MTTIDDPSQRLSLLPKFRQPPQPRSTPATEATAAGESPTPTSPAPGADSATGSGVLYEPAPTSRTSESDGPTPTAISSASDAVSKPSVTDTTNLLVGVLGLVAVGAAALVSWRLGRKLRKPTPGQTRDIAHPLAKIALRHFDPTWLNKDLADALAAATATGAYLGDGPLLLGAAMDAGVPNDLQRETA